MVGRAGHPPVHGDRHRRVGAIRTRGRPLRPGEDAAVTQAAAARRDRGRRHRRWAAPASSTTLAYAGEGALRRRHHEEQAEQMWCLTLATNAVVTWTTEYNGLAVTALRLAGRDVDDAVLAHIWPTHHENVHFYGTHSVDVDGELAKLDSDGYRPLRAPSEATFAVGR